MKLDLGCGKNKREGFIGVDVRDFGQEIVCDLSDKDGWWPTKVDPSVKGIFHTGDDPYSYQFLDDSVDEIHCSHFVEHLKADERINFVNEIYRVLKPEGKCQLIVPHWGSCRAYGDLTHQWPPVSEFWFYYLSKEWREQNAPHNDAYQCDFVATWGYTLNPAMGGRNQEFQQFATQFYKEAIQDIVATLTKPPVK